MASVEDLFIRVLATGGAAAAGELDRVAAANERVGATAKGASAGAGMLRGALRGFAALAVPAAMYEGVKSFASFQAGMERLHTQTGSTQAEVGKMSKTVLNMAGSVATSPNSLVAGLYHLESANIRGKNATDALRIAAEGAKVGGADLTDTVTAMTAATIAGFTGTKNLSDAMGQLNATVGAGDMSMQDLNESLKSNILATFKNVGLQVKDYGAALATLGDNNLRGSAASTALRMAVLGIVGPSQKARGELEKLHMQPLQMAHDLRKPEGLLVALRDLQGHLAGMDKVQRTQAIVEIFGKRQVGPILTLINQMDRLKSKYDEVGKGGKNFAEDYRATTKTLQFFIDKLKAIAEVWLIKLGMATVKVVGYLVDFVKGVEHGKFWMTVLAVTLALIAINFMGAAVAAGVLTLAMDLLALTPIIAVLVAIAVVIVLLITHFGAIKQAAVDAFHWMEHAAEDVWNWLKANWTKLPVIISAPISVLVFIVKHFGAIKDAAAAVWNWIMGVWKKIGPVLAQPFVYLWGVFKVIFGAIKGTIEWVAKRISDVFGILGKVNHALGGLNPFGGHFLHFAEGGPVSETGVALVGERGPELVRLPAGSNVTPNEQAFPKQGHGGDLVATIYNVLDGKVVSQSVVRQGLMAQARA